MKKKQAQKSYQAWKSKKGYYNRVREFHRLMQFGYAVMYNQYRITREMIR